jgi:hypothetical protein
MRHSGIIESGLILDDISKGKVMQNRKTIIGLVLIATLSALALIIPYATGWKISQALILCAIVLLSVYITLSFELVHRAVIALFGAALVLIILVATSTIAAEESFEFATNSIDSIQLDFCLA